MEKESSVLKREIKRAKLFEVQRLVRRMRQLGNKKGTEAQLKKNRRKIERFEKELEFLKDTTVAEIIRRVTNDKSEAERVADRVLEDHVEDSLTDIDLQRRAMDRIVNSTKLHKSLEGISANKQQSVRFEKRSSKNKKKPKTVGEKVAVTWNEKSVSGNTQAKEYEGNENSDTETEKATIQKRLKALKKKSTTNKLVPAKKPQLKEILDQDDSFVSGSDVSGSDSGEDTDGISYPDLKPKGLGSCFVQSMSGVKDDEKVLLKEKSTSGNKKVRKADKTVKRNRKGQRARQQMWEKVHGKSAKHLVKRPKEYTSKDNNEIKKLKSNNVKSQQPTKQTKKEEILHPSWQAMKRRRLQETMKVEFKGEKIRFDDSE